MGDWDISCAVCGVIFGPDLVEIESENGPSPGEPEYLCRYRYDRTKITKSDLQWLPENNALGLWPERPGDSKAYFTGKFFGSDYGSVTLLDDMDELPPWLENMEGELVTYPSIHDLISVFPFHNACYELLTRAILRRRKGPVDEEILYSAFVELADPMNSWALDISYGDPEPRDNRQWLSIAGYELLVRNPMEKADISAYFVQHTERSPAVTRSGCVLRDPFGKLPEEIRQHVLELLHLPDLSALRNASYPMHLTTLTKAVWKRAFSEAMPWLWEIEDAMSQREQRSLDLFRTLQGMQFQTTFASDEPDRLSLTLANRRRIWDVCAKIIDAYEKLLKRTGPTRTWTRNEDGCFKIDAE